jgi:hypothetical protein
MEHLWKPLELHLLSQLVTTDVFVKRHFEHINFDLSIIASMLVDVVLTSFTPQLPFFHSKVILSAATRAC